MNVVERAQDAYGQNAIHMKSPRDAEYEAIARITHRLRNATMNRKTNYPAFVMALHENNRLWTTLAAELAQPDNGLPKELRARLFWLAEFTGSETRKLLLDEGDVGILIEINAAVLHGLRGTGAAT